MIAFDHQFENIQITGTRRKMEILKQQHVYLSHQRMIAQSLLIPPGLFYHLGETASALPDQFRKLTRMMEAKGHKPRVIEKVLGANFVAYADRVWA